VKYLFYFIKGLIEEAGKDYIIIDNNDIGYKISVSSATLNKLGNNKGTVKIYTYFHVREDAVSLYGFSSKDELDMFVLLISVSGVGPKVALAMLSALSPHKLGLSIFGGDVKSLTSIAGVGNKTANRIILELKDKIDSDEIMKITTTSTDDINDSIKEAVNALMTLGYSNSEASLAVGKLNTDSIGTEEIIKAALKTLMK
jgi:Holliday junction DNA helicase RuvA